jgi:hypothetical protein
VILDVGVQVNADGPAVPLPVHDGAVPLEVAQAFVDKHKLNADAVQIITKAILGFGHIVVSEVEVPIILVNLV